MRQVLISGLELLGTRNPLFHDIVSGHYGLVRRPPLIISARNDPDLICRPLSVCSFRMRILDCCLTWFNSKLLAVLTVSTLTLVPDCFRLTLVGEGCELRRVSKVSGSYVRIATLCAEPLSSFFTYRVYRSKFPFSYVVVSPLMSWQLAGSLEWWFGPACALTMPCAPRRMLILIYPDGV